jgi:5-methylcytosine-specific restriction endonuclease McrA
MADLELIPHTKRKAMTKARAAKIFLAHNGKCINCGQQIRQGDGWFVEHPIPLAQGGTDDDANTAPAHTKCKAKKDATDAASKAKRDRIVTAGWDRDRPSRLKSPGFAKAKPQRSASRPITRRSEQT